MKWNILSDFSLWIVQCDHVLGLFLVIFSHVGSKVLGFGARMSVAPSFGEQPDPATPGCCYSWYKGSMMIPLLTETYCISFLLHS